MVWRSLPHELQAIIKQPCDTTLSAFVNACRAIPRSTSECILADHDKKLALKKQLHKMRKFMGAMNNARLPPSPPMDTGRFLPAPPPVQQQMFQRAQLPPSPPCDNYNVQQQSQPRIEEIVQMTFEDTPQGHVQYKVAMEQFVRNHPCATIQPPLDEPYPLTPGTAPAGSNECHRCGHRGHFATICPNAPVPQAEQMCRQMYDANSHDRRRQGNA
ncbi:hypothetical protein [Sporisorium scitamineum]|nr:hypothetical protein [Sporisorium scitamineum]